MTETPTWGLNQYTIIMTNIIFIWYVVTGVIVPTGDVDGRTIYTIDNKDILVEYAYRGEILEYLETGTFEHNEDLND
tara:strand:+ start:369 stop:599 length:231 start_codon:yes stop_codon:yes gene_type:complete